METVASQTNRARMAARHGGARESTHACVAESKVGAGRMGDMCKQCARTNPSVAHRWAVRDQAVREQREGAARGRAGSRHGAAEWEGREQTVSRESSRRLRAYRKQQQSETRDSAGAAAESDRGGSGERHGEEAQAESTESMMSMMMARVRVQHMRARKHEQASVWAAGARGGEQSAGELSVRFQRTADAHVGSSSRAGVSVCSAGDSRAERERRSDRRARTCRAANRVVR
jgi:hypothetical protein